MEAKAEYNKDCVDNLPFLQQKRHDLKLNIYVSPVNIFHLANVGERQFSSSRNVGKMMASNVGPEPSAPKSHFPPT